MRAIPFRARSDSEATRTSPGTPTAQPEPAIAPDRLRRVTKACQAWIKKLIDPSRRNNLLFFRELKEGTLDLSSASAEALAALLSPSEEGIPLDRFIDRTDLQTASGKLQEISRRARSNQEERGLETLYLALGLATWPAADGGRPYAAPVLLMPVAVEQQGTERRRVLLRRSGDVQPNLVLLHHLGLQGIDIQAEQLVDLVEGDDEGEAFDLDPAFEFARAKCVDIPEFAIDCRFILGNFSFQKMAMVEELRSRGEAFATHNLIAAIAQDPSGRSAVQSGRSDMDPGELDRQTPDQEFLVLDADSTQQRAIGCALAQQSGVISGPPGTGKSQTISNLIAECAARGQRVLFVAEKRAALEAVFKRLHNKGLGHLCLDLHGADVSRAKVMESIAQSLERVRDAAPVDVADVHRRYLERRERLNRHVQRMHAKTGSGFTIFELQGKLLRLPTVATSAVRWRGTDLQSIDAKKADEIVELLRELAAFERLVLGTASSPWARATLTLPADARRFHDLAREVSGTWTDVVGAAAPMLTDVGLKDAATLPELADRLQILCDAQSVLAGFSATVFGPRLPGLCEALLPARMFATRVWASIFNSRYRAARSEAASLRIRQLDRVPDLLSEVEKALEVWERWLTVRSGQFVPQLRERASTLGDHLALLFAKVVELEQVLNVSLSSLSLADLERVLRQLAEDDRTPFDIVRVTELETALRLLRAGPLMDETRSQKFASASWMERFRHAWLRSWLDAAFVDAPEIASFRGATHHNVVEEFKKLDQERLMLSACRVQRTHAENVIKVRNQFPDQDAIVKREAGKKRRHLPLRKLFQQAPDVMTALHPCWMASPLSVSQLLPADRQYFDVVIFDEASQVLPEDAVTSLYRGQRAVVAGDRRQLPPTTFFATETDGEGDEETATEGFESLLDVMSSFLDPAWGLDWHYRSRDESLIAFSNHHVYGDRLVTFPGAGGPPVLTHVLVPHVPGPADEESSSAEVTRVVELVMQHAEERPHETLGVIAMGLAHAKRVEAAIDRTLQTRPELAEFFDPQHPERFFVKNLERVQGDEREAIILTVGYGKDAGGQLPYRFGPLLLEGGERRLNVAVTRARGRMTVVSSFSHFDMDPARSSREGVKHLRAYLEYAASGGKNATRSEGTSVPLNDFEQAVCDALRERGVQLMPQWGASKYRIDLVARHPTQPGRFVLAVECDGATYHSSATARDRDRLRQQHLEALGWRFHRIWSTDWFLNRDSEIARFENAFRAAVEAAEVGDSERGAQTAARSAPIAPATTPRPSAGEPRLARPSIPRQDSINEYPPADIDRLVRWIMSDSLKTDDEVVAEAVRELGFARRGARIDAAIRSSIARVRLRP